jgi:hypothetical protein
MKERHFELALLDVTMPGEDGLSLARHVRNGVRAVLTAAARPTPTGSPPRRRDRATPRNKPSKPSKPYLTTLCASQIYHSVALGRCRRDFPTLSHGLGNLH